MDNISATLAQKPHSNYGFESRTRNHLFQNVKCCNQAASHNAELYKPNSDHRKNNLNVQNVFDHMFQLSHLKQHCYNMLFNFEKHKNIPKLPVVQV